MGRSVCRKFSKKIFTLRRNTIGQNIGQKRKMILLTIAALLFSLNLLEPTLAAPQNSYGYAAVANGPDNCLCQCSTQTYIDSSNTVNGNCRSFKNGKQWCYIKGAALSYCPDVMTEPVSQLPYSFHACATPAPTSSVCSAYSGISLPTVPTWPIY